MINNYKSSHVEKFKKLKAPEKDGFYTYEMRLGSKASERRSEYSSL